MMVGVSSGVAPTASALLVEDDARLASLTARYLEANGVRVTTVGDGIQGLELALRTRFDVVLLDLMLPGKSGLDTCRELRARSDVPIIVLTARGEEADRIVGLEMGADDYLAKPFSARELLARIRALLRRSLGQAGPPTRLVKVGSLEIDPGAMRASLRGRDLDLTSYEFNLLRVLAERAGRVLSREQLMELGKGSPTESFDRSIDVHISRLRAKLGEDPKKPRILKTIRGAGYVLSADVA
jgi:two-component system OmpR family response regulator